MHQMPGDDPRRVDDPPPAEVLPVERALGLNQLFVEFGERQPCRQHRMLNVVEPVVTAGDPAALGHPTFPPRIWRVDADVYDFLQLDTPFADNAETLVVPVRIGNQVDCDHDPERAGEFERLEIAAERNPLAVLAQSFFIDRLEADEHVFEAELFPEAKYFFVAQQHVAAGLEVIFLTDTGADDRFGDLHAVPLLHEGDIVDDEDTRFTDRPGILQHALRGDQPIAAAVKGPGAAKGAVPRAAPRELDRGARIERAEKIFPAMAQQVARRHQVIE